MANERRDQRWVGEEDDVTSAITSVVATLYGAAPRPNGYHGAVRYDEVTQFSTSVWTMRSQLWQEAALKQ